MEQVLNPGAVVVADSGPSAAKSAASWPSIIAGALVAAAATLVLVALGSGIGIASISPWSHGASLTAFAVTSAIWLIVTQWFSAALGGYIAGRLRTRWIGTHTHEVFFRDTAHGLITWAAATILVAAVAAGSLMSAGGAAARAATAEAGATAGETYSIDKLFRSSGSATVATSGEVRSETAHIVANAFASGGFPDGDRAYLVELVGAHTGTPRSDAQERVDAFISSVNEAQGKLKASAEAAKKAAAQASIYLALSMLIGAFIASVSAALGGRIRDQHI
jgi:hypothetical protein